MLTASQQPTRLLSLDFMRGLIMVLLALGSADVFGRLTTAAEGGPFYSLMLQFEHHPWHGLRAWDLIQPAFMFMAGAAMAYSLDKQRQQGMSWGASFRKTLKRSWWLFFWGVLDYAVRPTGLYILLWDVLTQLSFTTLVAFLVFRWSFIGRAAACAGLLVLTECLYRFTHVPGFDQPFTDQHNFGNYVDMLLMHTINDGGWVAINCIPTAVHTIVGTMAGQVLMGKANKVRTLVIWGTVSLVLGFGLDWAGITPIIKRIATSSFTLASMGWCLWILALSYWWIDVRDHRKGLSFFTIVGMNSIFIYLFFEIVGSRWFNEYIDRLIGGLLMMIHVPKLAALIVASLAVFACEWGLCYFLYKRKIFFRL